MIKAAEREIPMLDKELQQACYRYDSLSAIVETHRQALKLTEQELNEHAALRLRRDSLQVKFDTQCARVRFLHRKLDEVNTKASDRKKAAESPKTAK
jgi:chromosome segregation ATPase